MEIQILSQIIIILIGLYLAFFKSYFQEKGKYLATSEDIENITRKVEMVKKELEEDFAKTKSKIDILYNLELDEIKNEKSATINFHKTFSIWFNTLTSSLNLINDDDDDEIRRKMNSLEKLYNDVLNEYSLLEIYNDDDSFLNQINSLKINILKELAKNPQTTLLALLHNNEKKRNTENILDLKEKYQQLSLLSEEKKKILEDFGNNRVKGLENVIAEYFAYINYLKEIFKRK